MQKLLTQSVAQLHSGLRPKLYVFAGQGSQAKGMLDGVDPKLRVEAVKVAKDIIGLDLE